MKNIKLLIASFCLAITANIVAQNSWVVKLPEYGFPKKMIKTADNQFIYLALDLADNDNYIIYKFNMQGELLKQITLNLAYNYTINMFEATNGNIVINAAITDSTSAIFRFQDIDLEPEIIEVSAKFESFFEGNSEYVYIGEKSEGDTILGIKNINEVDVILNDISVIDNPGRKLLKINDGFILRDNIKNSEYSNYYYIVAPYELKISKDNLQR